jgi:acyl-coenzyme A synthetase/AMP-(fatty) acid ligase
MAWVELTDAVDAAGPTEHAEAILTHVRDRLAAFKVPRFVRLVDHLPKTPSERVAKGELARGASSPCYDSAERVWKQR